MIELDKMSVTGDGIEVKGNTILISQGGDYTVTGTQSNRMIRVNTEDKVKLRLSGMSLTSTTGPAIFFENTEKGFITITENTKNFLTDSSQYSIDDADAALFSNDDLEIKGDGTLTIDGNYKHGIASDDDLSIENGVITVKSLEHGLKANNAVNIIGGTLNITADTGKGIKAGETITVDAGTINIISERSEGIESKGTITINGGDINITAADDGINTGSESTQTEGTVSFGGQLPQGENGNLPEMPNGDMPQGNPPEMPNGDMPQGAPPEMPNGDMPQGNPPEMSNGGFGKIDEETAAAHAIAINGGNVYLNVGCDGIDSNGSLIITGGKIVIDGPENNGNGPLDSQGTISITGGKIITVSSAGMIQLPQNPGQNINFDTNPVIKNNTTLVGFRRILEALGAEVSWDGETQTVTAKKDDIKIVLKINSTTATVNGKEKTLLTSPEIINGSTMIPVRFISEQLGMSVDWDETTQRVSITSK